MRDDDPKRAIGDPAVADAAESTAYAARSSAPRHVTRRRREHLDPEALSIAIGARQRELADLAERRPDPGTPGATDQPPRRRQRGSRRRAAALALAMLFAGLGSITGFYWVLAAVTPELNGQASPAGTGLSKQERKTVERLLARLDFRVGAIDGRIDAETREAIRRYRKYQDIPTQGGRPTPSLVDSLREVAARVATDVTD
jgi:hypothetical protein